MFEVNNRPTFNDSEKLLFNIWQELKFIRKALEKPECISSSPALSDSVKIISKPKPKTKPKKKG
jgi:hypothetical protein